MKRTEMITKLAKWLDRSQSIVLMNGNEGKAKILLDQLEIWGMLPPYNPPNLDHGSITDCEWSPEEEMSQLEFEQLKKDETEILQHSTSIVKEVKSQTPTWFRDSEGKPNSRIRL